MAQTQILEGTRHRRPLRAPVSIEHLLTLQRALNLSNPFHAAIWAVALATFFGCRRLGETTVTSVSAFDGKYHVLRSVEYAAHNILCLIHTNHNEIADLHSVYSGIALAQ